MINESSIKKEVLESGKPDRDVVMAEIKQNLKALLSIHGSALERMEQEVEHD